MNILWACIVTWQTYLGLGCGRAEVWAWHRPALPDAFQTGTDQGWRWLWGRPSGLILQWKRGEERRGQEEKRYILSGPKQENTCRQNGVLTGRDSCQILHNRGRAHQMDSSSDKPTMNSTLYRTYYTTEHWPIAIPHVSLHKPMCVLTVLLPTLRVSPITHTVCNARWNLANTKDRTIV